MLKSLDGRIQDLTRAIIDDARAEVIQLHTEAKAKETEILTAGEKEADQIRKEILDQAQKESAAYKEKALADIQMQARMLWLERRELLFSKVFDNAKQRLSSLIQTPEYALALKGFVKEAVSNIQATTVRLHFDDFSRGLISDLDLKTIQEELKVKLLIGENIQKGIGVVAETEDGHRHYDNTLEVRLQRQQMGLRSAVYRILMGESQ